ncbi:hypothetical protein C8P68_10443 [Mucilaginibacter yixingensis]|uniref:Uncharacterized protein n=1 Tax=Mucilaginibacter yixingensis TaxID=1295612 RepID=A0A2T5J974_9SPHI|nr:DUF6691 family protein [Mucilaginibacter yixingensis]PTQ96559.1 hypothetical protein C8P68_10443 [Mucilaginibacter yixingensis]
MKVIRFVITGIIFGIIMVKSEAASWYRIQEMFRFQSFQMYGIIGTAIILGMISVYLIKKFQVKDTQGHPISFQNKDKRWPKYIIGGVIFGLGWALTGACPGPMFINLGYGYSSFLIIILGALLGTYVYGLIRQYLPH